MLTNAEMKKGRFLKLATGRATLRKMEATWNAGGSVMVATQIAVDADYASFAGQADIANASGPKLSSMSGGRFIRIVSESGGQRSAFGFVDKTNGNVLKSAGWKGPAKNFARGNITDEKNGTGRVRWTSIQ